MGGRRAEVSTSDVGVDPAGYRVTDGLRNGAGGGGGGSGGESVDPGDFPSSSVRTRGGVSGHS